MNHYTTRLKLRYDPFDTMLAPADFYPGGRRQCILDELLHFSRFSSQIAVITGPLGSGKSTLGHCFANSLDASFVIANIQASLFMDQVQLLDSIAKELGINVSQYPTAEKLIDAIADFTSFQADKSKTIQLIVDDAHELGADALQLVVDLVNRQVDTAVLGEGGIKLVLLGEAQLLNVLTLLFRIDMVNIELDALDSEEAIDYLRFKLSSSGYAGDFPLELSTLEAITARSGGIPGTLSSLASEELEQHDFATNYVPLLSFPERHLVAATVVFGVLLLGWFLLLDEDDDTEPGNLLADSNSAAQIQESSAFNLPAAVQPLPQSPEQVQIDDVATEEILNRATEPSLPVEIPNNDTVAVTDKASNAPLSGSGENDTSTEVGPGELVPIAREVVQEEAKAAPVAKDPVQADPLLTKPASSFTLQLLGSYSEPNAKKFITDNGGGDAFSYFETRFNEKPWFVVVYGNYADQTQAKAAIAALPPALGKLKPWARALSDIQQDIRKPQP